VNQSVIIYYEIYYEALRSEDKMYNIWKLVLYEQRHYFTWKVFHGQLVSAFITYPTHQCKIRCCIARITSH